MLWDFIGNGIYQVSLMKKGRIEDAEQEVKRLFINGLFASDRLSAGSDQRDPCLEIFEKNTRTMESSPNREAIFIYYQRQIESNLLNVLTGEKFTKYVESIRDSPLAFHVPCLNMDCTNVIKSDSLSPQKYCEECAERSSNVSKSPYNTILYSIINNP